MARRRRRSPPGRPGKGRQRSTEAGRPPRDVIQPPARQKDPPGPPEGYAEEAPGKSAHEPPHMER